MPHPRGEADIVINGETHKLKLTLGALADIEASLGGDFEALQARLKRPRISDVLIILHALLGGGGSTLTLAALKASEVDIAAAARAIADAFEALNTAAPPGKQSTGAKAGGSAQPIANGQA